MTIAKSINKTLDISVEDVRIDLTATIRSYDLTDTQFIFEIKSSNGMTVNLTGSTAMYIVEYVHKSQTYAIEGDVNITGTDTLSFNLPEDLKGYSGTVLIGIYVKLTDGTKIDIKDIAVRIEPSIMDKDIDFSAKTYFKDFETVKAEVILEGEKAKTEIKAIVADVQSTGDTAKAEIKATLPSLQTKLNELSESIVEISEDCLSVNVGATPNLVDGKFVNATNNSIASDNSFAMTEPIPVKSGQVVKLKASGYNNVVGMICVCNSDNTERSTVVKSIDSSENEYIYPVVSDGYICCSFRKNAPHRLSIIFDYFSEYKKIANIGDVFSMFYEGSKNVVPIVAETGKFVNANTNMVESSNNFNITDSIFLYKGQKIIVNATGYLNVVGMINLYSNGTYTNVVESVDNSAHSYEYTAVNNCNVRCSYNKNATITVTIVSESTQSVRLNDIEAKISSIDSVDEVAIDYGKYFDKCICIGDSLTYGMQDNSVRLKTNYPYFFTKITGTETENKGHSGWTAKRVWDDDISSWGNASDYDLAIIYLGTNGGLTDTVSTDCKTDYTQNADTNTGCYGKIIGKLKADNPNMKIFIVAGPNEYVRRANTMNVAVRKIASLYDVELIDLENSILSDDGSVNSDSRRIYRPKDGIHYDRRGYLTFASLIANSIKATVKENNGWKFIY